MKADKARARKSIEASFLRNIMGRTSFIVQGKGV
jgi:hypothetical protein